MEETWKASTDSVLTKINQIRRNLVDWAKGQAAMSKDWITSHQQLLETALSDASPEHSRIQKLRKILEIAYSEEEAFWRQRSRIQWLNGGDKNSSFFHAVTRNRRACNKFSIIENEEGQAFLDEDQITNSFVLFYQKLFTAGSTDSTAVVQEALTPRVTDAMNQLLISLPEKKEVKEAVFFNNPDKAPGPGWLLG